LQVPKPLTAFFAEDNLKTMKVERRPPPELNARVLEEINQEVVRQELMNVDDAADHADAGDDDDADMDADDGGGDD
jgi:senataxin